MLLFSQRTNVEHEHSVRIKWKIPASSVQTLPNYGNNCIRKKTSVQMIFSMLTTTEVLYISSSLHLHLFLCALHLFIAMCTSEGEQGSAEALDSESNFICFAPRNKPSWEVSSQTLSLVADNQNCKVSLAGFILDTMSVCRWPFICTQMKTRQEASLLAAAFQVMGFNLIG